MVADFLAALHVVRVDDGIARVRVAAQLHVAVPLDVAPVVGKQLVVARRRVEGADLAAVRVRGAVDDAHPVALPAAVCRRVAYAHLLVHVPQRAIPDARGNRQPLLRDRGRCRVRHNRSQAKRGNNGGCETRAGSIHVYSPSVRKSCITPLRIVHRRGGREPKARQDSKHGTHHATHRFPNRANRRPTC